MTIVDIRGVNSSNKGAQLMLEAVIERLGDDYTLSAPPFLTDYEVRARHGLRQTAHISRFPRTSARLGGYIPARLRTDFGLVSDRKIGGVVDASGLAYSDASHVSRVRREALFGRGWAKRGVPKILLPQAFGPFTNPEIRRWSTEVLSTATLVFSRDPVSTAHVRDLGFTKNVLEYPDFTIGVSAAPVDPIHPREFLAIVPNARMVNDAGIPEQTYVSQMAQYADAARAAGLDTVVVVHQTGDRRLGEALAARSGAVIFEDARPRVLKAALGQASAVLSSRFHAVVGALSQGVPTLAYGWSHKYVELLDDFGVSEWLVNSDDDPATRLSALLGDAAGQERLSQSRVELIAKVDEMWGLVRDALAR